MRRRLTPFSDPPRVTPVHTAHLVALQFFFCAVSHLLYCLMHRPIVATSTGLQQIGSAGCAGVSLPSYPAWAPLTHNDLLAGIFSPLFRAMK